MIFGDGSNSRDFCYVDNIVQANLLAGDGADRRSTGTVYNCGCNGRTDLKQLFAMIRDDLAKDFPEVAERRAGVRAAARPATSRTRRPRSTRSAAALGYVPTHQVAEGMAETVAWFAQRLRRK